MISRILKAFALAALALPLAVSAALAHPHVYVTMKSEIVYDAEGRMTGIRHHWTFDDMFSSYATQGLDSKEKGVFTREELQPLAEVNITSMKEFEFFTEGNGDVIAYVPVDGAAADLALAISGRAHAFDLAPTRVATMIHEGSFDDIDQTYGSLGTVVAELGIGLDGPIREIYLADDRAEVCWPITQGETR